MSELEFLSQLFADAPRQLPGSDAIVRRAARLSNLSSGARVLLLGPANLGPARLLVREFGCNVTCLGADEAAVARLRELVAREDLGDSVQPILADPLAFDAPEESFEAIFADGELHRRASLREFVTPLRRLLVMKGRLTVGRWARVGQTLPSPVATLFEERGERLVHPRDLAAQLEEAGFEPLAAEAVPAEIIDEHHSIVEKLLAKLSKEAASGAAESLRREIEVFRNDGGRAAVNYVLLVGRRKEPGERPPPNRGKD